MRPLLTILNTLLLISLLAWPMVLLMSPMLFDAPGSESNPITIAIATAIYAYPLPIIVGNILFWRRRKSSELSILTVYSAISLLSPVTLLLLFVSLALFCNGQFACH